MSSKQGMTPLFYKNVGWNDHLSYIFENLVNILNDIKIKRHTSLILYLHFQETLF